LSISLGSRAAVHQPFHAVAQWWVARKLAHQFLIAAVVVLFPGMAAVGWWVSDQITAAVTENTGHAAALYMEGSVAPLVQELATSEHLSPETRRRLDSLLADSAIRERVISMKVWRMDGTIVYSTWPDMIGQRFPPSPSFLKAAAGDVAVELDNDATEDDRHELEAGKPLLEIYAPVRATDSRRIIAISEFYANGEKLRADINHATFLSWLVVVIVTALMLGALSGIVYRGSRTIDSQRIELTSQVGKLQSLLAQNEELRGQLQRSTENIADMNERILQRLGADLHDGPAQLLTYALLRLNKFAPAIAQIGGSKGVEELKSMREAIQDTLREVRNLSEGLALPELGAATLQEAILQAISSHEQHTNTKVSCKLDFLPEQVSHPLKICVYRFVQEGLANAYHHADGIGQTVSAFARDRLEISVADQGPGISEPSSKPSSLGLSGLRARVEAIGGRFEIQSSPGAGTRLIARFHLDDRV
jgi:signal transduction histidine kinase